MEKLASQDMEERQRLGEWMPSSEAKMAEFRVEIATQARQHAKQVRRTTVVRQLADLVHGDAVLRMDLSRAIDDANQAGFVLGYRSIDELMDIIDYLMTYAPPFSESNLVHCPLNAVLDWPMCMPSGYNVFRDRVFNAHLKRVLNCWCSFLSGPHSRVHLSTDAPDGWFCDEADSKIGLDQFICDKDKPHWGFASWNAFFTRQFKDGVRPVDEPDNDKVIVSACEATPYNLKRGVQLHDRFWLKSQPYSLREIFSEEERDLADRFVGGDIYQAFLSGFNYHRWHAPVSGTVSRAYLVEGTYYSDLEAEGVDSGGLNHSQGYITAVAARAIICIDCDDKTMGSVACVFVGMAEVSSCIIDALPGQRVTKGDELGWFQYGGSTYCLVFQRNIIREFLHDPTASRQQEPVKVNARLAVAR